MSIEEMDAISIAIQSHFGGLSAADMRVSEKIAELKLNQNCRIIARANALLDKKIRMMQEVKKQKAIVNSRKVEFRINKVQHQKAIIAKEKQDFIMKAAAG